MNMFCEMYVEKPLQNESNANEMASSLVDDDLSLISKGLYRIVSDIVGPECIVKLRRQRWNIYDAISNCDSTTGLTLIMSGSRCEGFKFKSSDFDYMIVSRTAIVLTDTNMLSLQNSKVSTVLLMETDHVSPGFTLVRCLTCDHDTTISRSLLWKGSNVYVSSKLIRETFLSTSATTSHGPCQTVRRLGYESDTAFALKCQVWPPQAESFLRRSLRQGWPSHDVLSDICMDGCLLVPINSKQQQDGDLVDLEWRISFSLAEKKLICSMNHCQFLCYGLCKLFLNEVLKKILPDEDLLCSYYMKTAVFWEISYNSCGWTSSNFLSKFWNVFCRLINWVNLGYCPNFFIPENNMFYGKVCGEKQRLLLSTLQDLYSDGYWSLLGCPSLNKSLSIIITLPNIVHMISFDEEEYVPLYRLERERLNCILQSNVYISTDNVERIINALQNILKLNSESVEMVFAVRLNFKYIIQTYAESLLLHHKSYLGYIGNMIQYKGIKAASSMLCRTKTYMYMNCFLYAKHMYMTGNYHKTIEIMLYIKRELQSQIYMYPWTLNEVIIMAALQHGMPYDTLIKSFILNDVKMDRFTSIEELKLEVLAQDELTVGGIIFIPPLVFINFLLILSYTRLGEYQRRHDILDELHTLLYYDDAYHIKITHKAISWEILGICQQLCDDLHGAHQSYIHALDDEYNNFKHATVARLDSLDNNY